MDYKECANELLDYMLKNERTRCIVQKNISELAKGEIAVLLFLIDHNGVNAIELSEYFDINTSRVAAILNSLSKKDYIQRCVDEKDKRKIKVYITDKGKQFAIERKTMIQTRVSQLLEALGEEDAKNHVRIMKRVSEIMEHM